jgi:hypothetical protein
MKRLIGYALIMASLSVPAFAKNSQSVNLPETVYVGSTQLAAGNYNVTWTGNGSNVQVTIAQKGRATVTVPAKLVDAKNGHIGVTTDHVGGIDVLDSIQLPNLTLQLTGATAFGQ